MDDADQRLESSFEFLPDPIRGQNRTCCLKLDSKLHTVFLTDPRTASEDWLTGKDVPNPEVKGIYQNRAAGFLRVLAHELQEVSEKIAALV
jgi:hypothetical protein